MFTPKNAIWLGTIIFLVASVSWGIAAFVYYFKGRKEHRLRKNTKIVNAATYAVLFLIVSGFSLILVLSI